MFCKNSERFLLLNSEIKMSFYIGRYDIHLNKENSLTDVYYNAIYAQGFSQYVSVD